MMLVSRCSHVAAVIACETTCNTTFEECLQLAIWRLACSVLMRDWLNGDIECRASERLTMS